MKRTYIALIFTEEEYRQFNESMETLKTLSDGLDNDDLPNETDKSIKAIENATERGYKWVKNKMI